MAEYHNPLPEGEDALVDEGDFTLSDKDFRRLKFEDAEMQEPGVLTLAKGGSANIQVEEQWTPYQWYVNGATVGTTAAYTFTNAARDAGDSKRSASRRVRVTN
jgi:hypothetical protein